MGPKGLLVCLLLTALISPTPYLIDAGLVKKILRHRRQTLTQHGESNITLPSVDQPVVFNHVYNINVPASAVCTVDLDAPGTSLHIAAHDPSEDASGSPVSSGLQATEHTLDRENQIVFTHRINIPRQACGCAENMPDLKALLSRLEMLEGEVSTLRDQCGGGGDAACCGSQLTGEVGTKPYCNGHGNYSMESCGCICEPGWSGPNCTEAECPGKCQDRGACVHGKCECFPGFSGEDCSLVLCPVDCGENGRCVDGSCVCSEGFSAEDCSVVLCPVDCGENGQCVDGSCVCSEGYAGEDCSQLACLNACLGRGRCDDGDCVCDEPWTGADCSELICPKDCYDRGRCDNGTCYCDEGFTGEDCGERTCPGDCRGNGFCVDGRCVCSAGYSGEDCSTLTCLNNCNDRGTCSNGMCICHAGYQGEDCSQLACLNNCNTRGQCINGQCACDIGFQGEDCSELSCPNNCLDRGRCVNGQCVCEEGFAGEDCSVRTCPSDCFLRGDCVDGTCVCFIGFTGEDCGELSCPNNCLNRGRCVDGQCVCDEGFTGEDCGQKSCPNDCMARGVCVDGRCACEEGYAGDDCSVLTCPDNCNNRGRCVRGECVCEHGYEGLSCGELSCLNNCQDNGRCVDGQCVCDEGYIGDDCSQVSPPKDLTVTDVTNETVGLSWDNEMLVTEYLVTYVPTAPGGLYQEFTVPGDTTAANVRELEPGIEYLINVYAVLSNKRSVPVSARVATHLPQPEGLRFYSVRETSVEVQWDHLDITFDGWELYIRNTKEENGQVVNNLPPSQTTFDQSGLGPGQEYEVSLNVVKNNTRGPQTSKTFSTRIDGPRHVQVKDVTDSSALVAWSQPVAEVDGITVSYGPSSEPADQDTNTTVVDLSSSDSQYSLDGLDPDTQYQVTLTSRRGNSTSEPVTQTFTTDLDPPRDLQVVSQTDDGVTLQWSNSVAEVDTYRVKYNHISGGGSHGEEMVPAGPGDGTQVTVTGLKPGTEYGIGVTAVKNERESLPATTNTETELDPPRDLQVSDSSETSLTLEWQKPQAKITGYRLESVTRDGDREELTVPAADTTHVLTNLKPGMDYTFHLTAERGPKNSLAAIVSASTASFTFYLAASDVPELTPPTGVEDNIISFVHLDPTSDTQSSGMMPGNEPGHLNISGVTSGGFDVVWEPNATHGVYDSLAVECRDALRLWDTREIRLQGNASGVRIQGLKASTEYQIKLYGISDSQRSSALGEAVAVTASPPTSRGVIALSIKDEPTLRSTLDAVPPTAPSDHLSSAELSGSSSGASESSIPDVEPPVSSSGASESSILDLEPSISSSGAPEPESSILEILGELLVTNVTAASVELAWFEPPDVEAFDSFLVELSAVSGPAQKVHERTLPGGFRRAEIGGLAPATRYDISVYGLVAGERSLPIKVSATTEELKPVVVNLTISDITWDSFNVSWGSQDGDFEGFVIEVTNMEHVAESQNLTLSGDAFSLGISGLTPNTSYLVGLYGMHQGDFLEPVFIEATTVNEPALGNLYVSYLTSESFTLSWNDTEGEFDGYVLEIIDSDWLREPEEHNVSQNAKSHDITGLRSDSDYIAYLYGTLKGSRTHAVSIVASTAPEPDLSRLVVSNITSDRFALSWRAGGKAFDNFIVEVRESALPSQAVGRSLPGDARSTLMAGLKASTRYDIKLYASAGGQKTQPLFAVATTEDVPQFGTVAASAVSPDNFTLSWSTLSGHFDGFVIRVSDSDQMSDTLEFTIDGEVQNFTVSKLTDATAYDIELFGISHGRRTPSVLSHATTAALPKVENMTITNVTPYGFRVSWEMKDQEEKAAAAPSGGGFSHFHVVVTDSGWLLKPHEFTIPGNQTWLDIWGLITGIGYEVRLTAVSNTGLFSRPLTTVAVTEAEPEVEHLFVSDVTEDSLRLTWTADEDLFDRFVIKIRDTKKLASPQEHVVFGDERTKVLSGLMGGTEYELELYGIALDQRSQPITGVAHTGLGSPRGLQFSEITDTSAMVEWNTPRSRVDSYRLVYVPLYGGNPVQLTVDSDVSQTTLTNMSPGTTYQVTVTAVKGLEESPPTTDTVTTALDKPQGLTAVNVTDTSALLLWQPSVATVDGYVITYSAESVAPVEEHVSGNVVEFEMGSLVPATRYTVDVYATRETQQSASATTDFTTEVDSPRDLEVKDVHTESATVTWKPPQADVAGYTLTYTSPDGITKEVLLSPTSSSYSMKQLSGSTEYTVTLQAVTRGQKSRHVNTVFTTIGTLYSHPKDCAQVFLNGETTSGVYTIYLGGDEKQPIQAYCDMDIEGGGWTVFLRRQDGKLNFYKNWKNYTAGFGDLNNEFWMGLSSLHKMTSSGQYELRVDLRDGADSAHAQYDKFIVAEPRSRYKLYIGVYSGTAGDSMNYHHGRPFSTYDNDNDIAVTNCALSYKGAFWYKNCHRVNLMGKYGDDSHSKGINWFHWKGHEHSIPFAEMKLRPVNFRNFESRRKRS